MIHYAPPSLLPYTSPAMKTAGFWISRHPDPDKIILSPQQINDFNRMIRDELKLTKDLSVWPEHIPGREVEGALDSIFNDIKERHLVFLDGQPISTYFGEDMERMTARTDLPEKIPRQYGLIVRYADQRFLPTEKGIYAAAQDIDFDELQNSALDIGTPVVVLHQSADGQWVYVESSSSSGWIQADCVGIALSEEVNFFWSAPFVVLIDPKVDVYTDIAMRQHQGYIQMGTRLPFVRHVGDTVEVKIPIRTKEGKAEIVSGYLSADQVHEGYLVYTPRTILRQAFKMLHQPYGWGGMYGEQDCSRLLQQIFATVGVELPRDSKNQIQVGRSLAAWPSGTSPTTKLTFLIEEGIGGIMLLGMKGHIMLYLGTLHGRAYAIHSVWAYRQPGRKEDNVYVLNRVTLSDLSLGEKSKRSSLLERLNTVRLIGFE